MSEEFDPGIRETVALLQKHGFDTTDSGDGVSKPQDWYDRGEALPFPHVAMMTYPTLMVSEAHRAQEILGPDWVVEASYDTQSEQAILFACKDEPAPTETPKEETTPGAGE